MVARSKPYLAEEAMCLVITWRRVGLSARTLFGHYDMLSQAKRHAFALTLSELRDEANPDVTQCSGARIGCFLIGAGWQLKIAQFSCEPSELPRNNQL